MTPEEHVQSAELWNFVRKEWKNAGNPESRAEVEQAVRDALADRANRVMRRAFGRCEACGDLDKDQRIADLEKDLADAGRTLGAVRGLFNRKRKTLRMDDLRAALYPEEG